MGSAPSDAEQDKANVQQKRFMKHTICLNIAFFDYGVCASPFRYYTQDSENNITPEIVQLQTIFKEQFKQQFGLDLTEQFRWDIGRLDRLLKKGRYSTLYYDDVGIINNKFLMDRTQFRKKWEEAFNIVIQNFFMKDQIQSEQMNKHKDNLFKMDWIHYRTFVVCAYKDDKISFDRIIEEKTASKYMSYMKKKFESKVINEKYKIQKLIRRLKKFELDIFFLQDVDERILNLLQKKTSLYRMIRCGFNNSAILISWKGLYKIVGESIKPFYFYNSKVLDPTQTYTLSPETQELLKNIKQADYVVFDDTNRNFRFANPKNKAFLKKKVSKIQAGPVAVPAVPQQKQKPLPNAGDPKINSSKQVQQKGPVFSIGNLIPNKSAAAQKNQPLNETNDPMDPLVSKIINMGEQIPRSSEVISQPEPQQQKKIQEQFYYISKQLFDDLIWNEKTIVQFFRDIILITSSIDVDENQQEKQYEWMVESLIKLKKQFPVHVIIVAVNIQKQLGENQIEGYKIYPSNFYSQIKQPTVFNCKTLLQSNLDRSKALIEQTQDYFITSVTLQKPKIIDIDQNQVFKSKRYIPNQDHPYDHFLLSASFECQVTKKIKDQKVVEK